MHKSWGNAIDFDEAAERMGVDVMRWLFAKARPEENINFGWHAADEARRELLVLWNVYAFFVTYARLAGWTPRAAARRGRHAGRAAPSSTAGSGRAPRRRPTIVRRPPGRHRRRRRDPGDLDVHRRPLDVVPAPVAEAVLAERRRGRSRRRRSRRSTPRSLASDAVLGADPAVPDRVDVRQPRRATVAEAPDSVHLTRWPADELAPHPRRRASRGRWRPPGRAVELARTLRGSAGHPDAPAARPAVARAARRRPAGARGAPRADPRRGQRPVGRADRRRVGARRAAGEAAPAEDRQEARRRRSPRSWPPPARTPSSTTPTAPSRWAA